MKKPLVSVRILTYNSSKYIIDTLESVYDQTYQNIELIISDDCSTDNTVEICNAWLVNHANRFAKVIFLTSPVNTGVCANSKRSLDASTGDWIKGLGGDDCLSPEAIERFVDYVHKENCQICAAKIGYINEDGTQITIWHGVTHASYLSYTKLSYKEQFNICKLKVFVPGPSLFYSRYIYKITGGPDAKYGTSDEWSFLYKVLKNGFKIYGVDDTLIYYRVRESSITHGVNQRQIASYIKYNDLFYREVIRPDLVSNKELLLLFHHLIARLQRHRILKFLNLFDPFWYKYSFRYSMQSRFRR